MRDPEPVSLKIFRWLGMFAFGAAGLGLAGLVLYFVFRAFDRETLIALLVLACLAMFITWPLAWMLAVRNTERFYLLLQASKTPAATVLNSTPTVNAGLGTVFNAPYDRYHTLPALNLSEDKARAVLQHLEG